MLVGQIFEIWVSFWVVGGRLGACWQLEGVIGAFGAEHGRLEERGGAYILTTRGVRALSPGSGALGGTLGEGKPTTGGQLTGTRKEEKGERKMETWKK